jgi:hypothetical protein
VDLELPVLSVPITTKVVSSNPVHIIHKHQHKTSTGEKKKKEIKVCFCPQKHVSPPVPQTVVIGKKYIWVTNKIKLQ